MTNETQTLILGEVDIGSYVKEPSPIFTSQEKEEAIKIKNKLSQLKRNNNLSFEKFLTERLENELGVLNTKKLEYSLEIAGYPEIDLSFLSKSYDKKVEVENAIIDEATFWNGPKFGPGDISIKVPAFSIYPFYGESNEFSINYDLNNSTIGSGDDPHRTCLNITIDLLWRTKNQTNKEILSKNIMKSMTDMFTFLREHHSVGYIANKIKKEGLPSELKYFASEYNSRIRFKLTSQFNGIIPEETKQKVEESKKYFEKEDIYLTSETKPEKWGVEHIEVDPLIIGIHNEKAYLIDHFDCTPLENLVKDIYTKDKSN